jgi:ABC-type amino acid transport substrate-binding protein
LRHDADKAAPLRDDAVRAVPASSARSVAMATNGEHPDKAAVGELKIPLFRNAYVTVASICAMLAAVASATFGIVHYVEVRPLNDKIVALQQTGTTSDATAQGYKGQLSALQQQYEVLRNASTAPVLTYPPDRSSVIGNSVLFTWDYKKRETVSGYMVEIRELQQSNARKYLNTPASDRTELFYSFGNARAGEYLWRVRPGSYVEGVERPEGPWSRPATFSVYSSVEQRIRATGHLTVTTTPTTYDAFVAADNAGHYHGYEIELARWLTLKLGPLLQTKPLTLEVVDIPWSRLFDALQNGETDVAIRSITRSNARERDYSNLRFTVGYLRNHQVLVQSRDHGAFPGALAGARVGAKNSSINEKAARFLVKRYHYHVDATFVAYDNLYDALRRGRIDFAIVDSALVGPFLKQGIERFGPELDNDLKGFYRAELGRDFEEYAVLVHESTANDRLRPLLNSLLQSKEFDTFNALLKRKYGLS